MIRVLCRYAALVGLVCLSPTVRAQSETPERAPSDAPKPATLNADQTIQAAVDALDTITPATAPADRQTLLETIRDDVARVRSVDPDNPWLEYLYGRMFIVEGRRRDAITQLEKFVKTRVGRNEWRALRLLGDLFVDEFPRLAQQHYHNAAELKVDDPGILFGLSRCAHKLGAIDEAMRLAHQATEADGRRTVGYLVHVARLAAQRGEWDDATSAAASAVSLAEDALRVTPGESPTLATVDAQYQLLIEVEEARVRTLQDATRIADGCLRLVEAIRRRADTQLRLARHDAVRVLQSAVQRTQPDTPVELLESYGIALAEVGKTETAIGVFERILARSPDNSLAVSWLDRLRREQGDRASAAP